MTHITTETYVLVLIADREVQRILLELLNQMDGFDQTVNVKVRSVYTKETLNIKNIMLDERHKICVIIHVYWYLKLLKSSL